MTKYNCTICGAGCYSADTTKTICAECEKDGNLVEVVRCKDCCSSSHIKWHKADKIIFCSLHGSTFVEDGYCSKGERREK